MSKLRVQAAQSVEDDRLVTEIIGQRFLLTAAVGDGQGTLSKDAEFLLKIEGACLGVSCHPEQQASEYDHQEHTCKERSQIDGATASNSSVKIKSDWDESLDACHGDGLRPEGGFGSQLLFSGVNHG